VSNKDETLYCRMDAALKARIDTEAGRRGESASVIVREALRAYFALREPAPIASALRELPSDYAKPAAKSKRNAA